VRASLTSWLTFDTRGIATLPLRDQREDKEKGVPIREKGVVHPKANESWSVLRGGEGGYTLYKGSNSNSNRDPRERKRGQDN
jgi:hypothetical protein